MSAPRSASPDPDEVLADSDALYRVLVDGMGEGMVVQTADGGIVSANAAAQRILGLTATRMEGRTSEDLTWDVIHPDGSPFPGIDHPALTVLRTGEPQVDVVMGFARPGEPRRWLRVSARPLAQGPDGLPAVVVTTFADITAEREAIEALTVTQQHYQTLVETLPLVTYVDPIGLDQAVTFISPQIEEMFGYPSSYWYDRPGGMFLELLHPEDEERVRAWYAETSEVGDSAKLTYRMVARDGRTRWIEDASKNVRDPQTGEATAIGYLRDVTEEVDIQDRLAVALDDAVRASSAKGDFLATMSHEIRTPMNGIVATVELLQDAPLDDEGHQLVRILGDAVRSLQDILDDVLDFSKIESGKATVRPEPFDVTATARGVAELLAPAAARKTVRLRTDLDPRLPSLLVGDPGMLRQVLLNLAGNAVKFTDEGEVTVSARAVGSAGDRVMVAFEVRDTGPGIAPGAIEELFQPFVQVDASAERRHGGTGLGLAISDRLVKLMDGTLEVQSTLGEGATFTVTLPYAVPHAGAQEAGGPGALASPTTLSGRVLLVEDNPTNRAVGLRQLTRLGLEAVAVPSGEEGVRAVAREAWDCVLMDCQMPGMDGFAATRAIRAQEGGGRRTPVVAMTANAMQGDREACLEAGMDDYLAKPVTLAALGETLGRWLPGDAGASASAPAPAPAPSPPPLAPNSTEDPLGGSSVLLGEDGSADGVLDATVIAALREDLGDAVAELVGLYVGELPGRIGAVRRAVDAGDGPGVAAAAHSLRGASATFGAAGLADLCAALEDLVREGRLDALAAAAAPLEPLAEATRAALDRALA